MRLYMRLQLGLVLLAVGCCCSLARPAADSNSDCDDALNTYFLSVSKPVVTLAGAGRAGTTRIQVQLHQAQVSSSMPVVKASPNGMTHDVIQTWRFLEVSDYRNADVSCTAGNTK